MVRSESVEAEGSEGRLELLSSTKDSSVLETVSRKQLMLACSNNVFITSEEAPDILEYATQVTLAAAPDSVCCVEGYSTP